MQSEVLSKNGWAQRCGLPCTVPCEQEGALGDRSRTVGPNVSTVPFP